MKEELKQAIDFKAKEISENSNGSWMDMCTESIESTLQDPSILRHADPEIMKQAGWVRDEEWISVEEFNYTLYKNYQVYDEKLGICIAWPASNGNEIFWTLKESDTICTNVTHIKNLFQPPKQ